MSLRLPPKVRERMRPCRSVISQRLAGQGTILQRRSCERQSIRRQDSTPAAVHDEATMMMCIDGPGFKSDAETALKELLNMPSDFEFSSLDLMTFGDLDKVDVADYRRRSESEPVGMDFHDSTDLQHVFGDACAREIDPLDNDERLKHEQEEDSIIFLEERAAKETRECTLFKNDADAEAVEIVHVGRADMAGSDATLMKKEDEYIVRSSMALTPVGCQQTLVVGRTSAVSCEVGNGGDESREKQAPSERVPFLHASTNDIYGFSAAIDSTSFINFMPHFSPDAASSLLPLPSIEIPYSAALLAPLSSQSIVSHAGIASSQSERIFSSSLLRPVPSKAVLDPVAVEQDAAYLPASNEAKRASVKIGDTEYRLVLPSGDSEENGFDVYVGDAQARPCSPVSPSGVSFRPIDDAPAPALAVDLDAQTPASSSAVVATTVFDSAQWNHPVDGCQLRKIETLMNSKTLRKAKRRSHYKKYSNIGTASVFNKRREIFRPFNAQKKIFIVVPESVSGFKKHTKFVFKTSSFMKVAKSTKAPKHPLLRNGGEAPSTPKMFSKAAVQRNVLYMKSGDKLGYKKIRKMSSCSKNGHRCGCPLKNKQSICLQESVPKEVN